MTATQRACQLYQTSYAWRLSFEEDVWEHMSHAAGYVIATPDNFAMGFLCDAEEALKLPTFNISNANPSGDCWFVWLAVGNVASILTFIPFEVPWVAFARRGQRRIYAMEKLLNHAGLANWFDSE
jgi:hypothetical protein